MNRFRDGSRQIRELFGKKYLFVEENPSQPLICPDCTQYQAPISAYLTTNQIIVMAMLCPKIHPCKNEIIKLHHHMKMTKPTFVMATICLNFSYAQMKEKSPAKNQLQLYRYGFSGFKSCYKPGFRIKKEIANRGKTLTVRNYTIEQLFAIAYGAGVPISKEQVVIEVTEPKKLQEIRCYRLFVPQQQSDNFYLIMQQNLHMEFHDYIITVESKGNKKWMIIKDVNG